MIVFGEDELLIALSLSAHSIFSFEKTDELIFKLFLKTIALLEG